MLQIVGFLCVSWRIFWHLKKQEMILRDHLSYMFWEHFCAPQQVREVSRFRQGKQRAVGGCLLFLQLFYYESIAVDGLFDSASVASIPYLSSWGEEEIAEREKRERELGGYGLGEVICKERGLGMGMFGGTICIDGLLPGDAVTAVYQSELDGHKGNQSIPLTSIRDSEHIVTSVSNAVDSVRALCQISEAGWTATTNSVKEHNMTKTSDQVPHGYPFQHCNFLGLSEPLSPHFSSEHLDSSRPFKYNIPLTIYLDMKETVLVLQAEEDGRLFLLHKGTVNVGHTIGISCMGPSWSEECYPYDIISERRSSSLRLISDTKSFPGQVEDSSPIDFLVLPFSYADSSGQLKIQICIHNSTNIGAQ